MKLVEGQTLQQLIEARQASDDSLGELIGIFESVAQTIAYVHAQHGIHRESSFLGGI